MKPAPASSISTVRRLVADNNGGERIDTLAVEEPLEIRLQPFGKPHRPVSITMRTPGNDLELAAGFLFTEAIVANPDNIRDIRHCGKADGVKDIRNTVVVELAEGVEVDLKRVERNFYTTSSCGVCGKSSIEALETSITPLLSGHSTVGRDVIHSLAAALRESQNVFEETGGLHASALFSFDGKLNIVREDVGRHNALDKVIGSKFLGGETPLSDKMLVVSGRASFELVQKALMAGIPIMAAVGAPSSLAVDLADEYGMTLIGFLRDGRFNVYSGDQRIEGRNTNGWEAAGRMPKPEE